MFMNMIYNTSLSYIKSTVLAAGFSAILGWAAVSGQAAVNPNIPFYGSGGVITATPSYPIVGQNTHITVTVGNSGDQTATNVRVKISFNDWGVTFMGWQEISTVLIPSIAPGGTATAQADYVFHNRTHTCLEAVIVGADQDGNLDDNRGQINLEVINAGETFSYGIPIQNNGDQPLHMLLMGKCGAAAGTVQHECPEVPPQIEVKPGEQVMVPIQVNLRGFAVGQPLVFVLDAFDLGAANPLAPANHNHVELHIIRQTARNLKMNALADIVTLRDQTAKGPQRNNLDAVVNHIALALNPKSWLDDNHVRPAGGPAVFAQEKSAAEKILNLLEGNLPLTTKIALNEVLLKLNDADRILAQTANQEAGGIPSAAASIQSGDQSRTQGNYPEAIQDYLRAWQSALRF
jgi:hypothetical protein